MKNKIPRVTKPTTLYEAEFYVVNAEDVLSASEPHYSSFVLHMSKEMIAALVDHLQEKLLTNTGSIIFGVTGRRAR